MIPFAPPHIDQKVIDEVAATLKSGWITTGPRTKEFERKLTEFNGCKTTLCLNSATAGLEVMLRWFGVKEGDEVILPAYTYAATANVIMHCGATPVFVDVNRDDFNISPEAIRKAITPKTKVIMPVDFAGFPCDYASINAIAAEHKTIFRAEGEVQQKLGRILILADAAHSIGATYHGKRAGSLTDVSVFSFHAVKNLTTAEGGAVAFNLPEPFDNTEVYNYLCIKTLHGQNKDALAKSQKGNWRYDIIEPGYKCNITDIVASIGLVELERYDSATLKRREAIFNYYSERFKKFDWAEVPVYRTGDKVSSFHVYALRIRNITEDQRDMIIKGIFDHDVAVNVHFIPVPMMSYYKKLGYSITDYPVTFDNYSREISLPVFFHITDEQLKTVADAVITSVEKVLKANHA